MTALCDITASQPTWLALDPSERRTRITTAVCTLFRNISEGAPLVLVAEDLHWADTDSIHVLGKLAETAHAHRMLVVLTSRDDSEPIDMVALGGVDLQSQPIEPSRGERSPCGPI